MNPTPSAPQNPTPSRDERIREAVESLQTELDTLRLHVKYLAFDLEATRRERDHAAQAADGMARRVERQNQIIATYRRRYGA